MPLKSSGEMIAACNEPYDRLFRFTPGMLLNWKNLTHYNKKLRVVYADYSSKDGLTLIEEGRIYIASKTARWSLTL